MRHYFKYPRMKSEYRFDKIQPHPGLMGGQADRISDNPNHKRGFNQCRRSLHKFGDKSSLVHRFHIFFCTLISKCNQTCSGLRGLGETKRRKSERVVNLRMAVVENIPLIHRAATPMVTQFHQPTWSKTRLQTTVVSKHSTFRKPSH